MPLKWEATVLKCLNLLDFEGAGTSYAIEMYIVQQIRVVFDETHKYRMIITGLLSS